MITVPELTAEALSTFLATHLNRRFGSMQAGSASVSRPWRALRLRASATVTRSTTLLNTRCS
jgi:hypothetical protein